MASNKMLIDASHREETRVTVVRGNRIEEYDFESQEKRQLRGNIYLAKVTRVEPSLQAAFVDYGGNRHGFLAFSEIHPDYYQIPMADRQALLEEEANDARASREAEDRDEADSQENNQADADTLSDESESVSSSEHSSEEFEETPKPKKRRSRRTSRKPADATEPVVSEGASFETVADDTSVEAEPAKEEKPKRRTTRRKTAKPTASEEADASPEVSVEGSPTEKPPVEASEEAETAVEEKPKRRATRRKAAPKKAKKEEDTPTETEKSSDISDESDDEGSPKTMSAAMDMDVISEELPEDESDKEPESDTSEAVSESAAEEVPEKPKRKTTRRTSRKKKEETPAEAEATIDTVASNTTDSAEVEAKVESEPIEASSDAVEAKEPAEEDKSDEEQKPKKRNSRRNSRRSRKKEVETDDENNDEDGDGSVDSVGQEDAMEEVPVRRKHRRQYKIQEVIKRRQVLLVQVVKEERGNKGAALTTYLSLAGRYSVLMPNTARGGGISRKITNANDRKRLKTIASELEVPNGMGVILRTAGASRTKAEIQRDFEYLMRLWENVRNTTLTSTAPCLVYEEGSLIKRSIRDLYNKDIGEILVTGQEGFEEAKGFMGMLMPSHEKNVKLYQEPQAMFAKYGVEAHLEKMLAPQVTMKSGGYLVINQTEALVAIDVNSGRSTREHSIEDTALQTNLEAAEEVARQLRLRDLAGLIVIDFIDMEEKRNNRAVEKRLKDCLKSDRARIQVGRISHFGLMEMSRQRMRASVLESTMDVCPHCAGLGYVRSDSAIALHVFRAIEEHLARNNRHDAIVRTTPAIALYILNHKRQSLSELEERYGLRVFIEGDASVVGQDFAIDRGENATGTPNPALQNQRITAESNDTDSSGPADNDDEEGGKRKRKRRRGKRKPDSEQSASDENASETPSDDEVGHSESNASGDDSGDNEEQDNKRRRRRGKRGGRRNRNAGEEEGSEDTTAEASSDTVADDPSPETASEIQPEQLAETASDESANDDEDAKPKRATSRPRRSKKVTEATEPAETESAPEAQPASETEPVQVADSDSEATDEPKRAASRNTRRKKSDESDPTEPVVVVKSEEVASEETAEVVEEKSKKKKGGWWSRGAGFFS